jgi:hypothetical protein
MPRRRTGLCQRHQHVSDAAQRDERLDAVQAPAVAIADGTGTHVLDVIAGFRLGDRDGQQALARDVPARQFLMLVAAVRVEDRSRDVLDQHGDGQVGIDLGHLLHRDRLFMDAEGRSAELFRRRDADQPGAGRGDIEVAREALVVVRLLPAGTDLAFGEHPAHVPECRAIDRIFRRRAHRSVAHPVSFGYSLDRV